VNNVRRGRGRRRRGMGEGRPPFHYEDCYRRANQIRSNNVVTVLYLYTRRGRDLCSVCTRVCRMNRKVALRRTVYFGCRRKKQALS